MITIDPRGLGRTQQALDELMAQVRQEQPFSFIMLNPLKSWLEKIEQRLTQEGFIYEVVKRKKQYGQLVEITVNPLIK